MKPIYFFYCCLFISNHLFATESSKAENATMQIDSQEYKLIARGHGTLILHFADSEAEYVVKAVKNKLVQAKKNKEASIQHSKFSTILDQEYQIGSLCDHPNLVRFYSLSRESEMLGGNYYAIRMERLHGDAHKQYVQNQQGGGSRELREMFAQICAGVKYLHAKGIAHNDLKPENIFLTKEGRPKVGDFGCARIQLRQSADFIRQEWAQRSLQYASPEVFDFLEQGELDELKSDIFALGQTLYVIAYGNFPKRFLKPSEKCEIYRHIISQDVASFRESVAKHESELQFLDLIMKMMNPDVELRFDIDQVLQHEFFQEQ